MDVYWDDDEAAALAKKRQRNVISQQQQQQLQQPQRSSSSHRRRRGSSSSGGSSRSDSGRPVTFHRLQTEAAAFQQQYAEEQTQQEQQQQQQQMSNRRRWGARGRLQPQTQQSNASYDANSSISGSYRAAKERAAAAAGSRATAADSEMSRSVSKQQQQLSAATETEDEEEGDEDAGLGAEVEQQLLNVAVVMQQLQDAVAATGSPRVAAAGAAFQKHRREVRRLHQQVTTALAAVDLDIRSVATSLSYRRRAALLRQRQQQQQQLEEVIQAFEECLLQQSMKETAAWQTEASASEEAAEAGRGAGDSTVVAAKRETLVRLGDEIQDSTQASLFRSKQLALETEEMGGVVLGKMEQQTEQLQRTGQEVDAIQSNVARAKKTAVALARNAAGDRFAQCLCLFIFLFLVIAIVLVCVPRGK